MNRAKPQKGFVLFVVLWVITIMGVTSASFAFQVRMESQISHHMRQNTQLRWAAHGGMHHLVATLRQQLQSENLVQAKWWQDESFHQNLDVAGFSFTTRIEPTDDNTPPSPFAIQDLESRLNVNRATADQLARIPGLNTVIAEEIARWVRAQKERLPKPSSGRSDSNSTDSDEDSRLPLSSLDALLQLPSVDQDLLYEGGSLDRPPLSQLLTVLSNGRVNINTAASPVLTALGFDEGQVNTILAVQKTSAELFNEVDEVQSRLNLEEERWQQIEPFITTTSSTFEISGRAIEADETLELDYHVSATAVVTDKNISFLSWREGDGNDSR